MILFQLNLGPQLVAFSSFLPSFKNYFNLHIIPCKSGQQRTQDGREIKYDHCQLISYCRETKFKKNFDSKPPHFILFPNIKILNFFKTLKSYKSI